MRENLREKGSLYEKIAGEYLKKKGYQILEYNYRCRYSEIDIIAKQGEYYVFCEVKYRKTNDVTISFEAINMRKQQKISKAALFYLTTHGLMDHPCRFDVIGIAGKEIKHIENAFEYRGV